MLATKVMEALKAGIKEFGIDFVTSRIPLAGESSPVPCGAMLAVRLDDRGRLQFSIVPPPLSGDLMDRRVQAKTHREIVSRLAQEEEWAGTADLDPGPLTGEEALALGSIVARALNAYDWYWRGSLETQKLVAEEHREVERHHAAAEFHWVLWKDRIGSDVVPPKFPRADAPVS